VEPSRPTGRPTASASSSASTRAGRKSGTSARARRRARRSGSGRRLFAFDRRLGPPLIAGADEAGRGCLAGPLVAAGVLFDYDALTTRELRALSALNDSKQHSAQAREELFPLVLRSAERVIVISRCVRGIDERGLHKTNLAALRDALIGVTRDVRGEVLCLSDGFPVRDFGRPQRAIVDGDATSAAIAAASIVAKVTRDRYMHHADSEHPGWSFAEHVGYSTPEHREAILRQGVSPLHRMSFQSLAYQQLAL
jgi:ribonuclease HII